MMEVDENVPICVASSSKRSTSECKICKGPAIYSFFGVVACASCKMFFKRNAESKQNSLVCPYDGSCQIDANNRRLCAACRLAKCFASGMSVELIRANRSSTILKEKNKKNAIKRTKEVASKSTAPVTSSPRTAVALDHSILTTDQWTHLTNLVHCYDEHSNYALASRFLSEQNTLPPRIRFKVGPVSTMITSLISNASLLFEKNADFLSLNSNDRSLLLQRTMSQVGGLGATYIALTSGLYDNPTFYESTQMIYGPVTSHLGLRAALLLDRDVVFVKVILVILMFSTFDPTYYTNKLSSNLKDVKSILRIQDAYVELAWRYLIYRYDHQRAVLCFSNLMRSLFAAHASIVAATELQQFNHMIDSLIQQSEESLRTCE